MINLNSQIINQSQSRVNLQQESQGFSRELLATVWQRMGQMSSIERNILINHLQSIGNDSHEVSHQENSGNIIRAEIPRPFESRRQLFNVSSSPLSQSNSEYIDFRLYPITIDWNQIENGESYFYNLFIVHGYFGVAVITSLLKIQKKFKFSIESLYQIVLDYYHSLVVLNQEALLVELISLLPSLTQMHEVLKYSYYSLKELPLIKLTLDIYENYLFCYSYQLEIKLRKEYIIVSTLFYQTIKESDLKLINDEFLKHKKLMKTIDALKMNQYQTKENYLNHINDLEIDYQSLLKGTNETMFIL